jgi:hypothetical protein
MVSISKPENQRFVFLNFLQNFSPFLFRKSRGHITDLLKVDGNEKQCGPCRKEANVRV